MGIWKTKSISETGIRYQELSTDLEDFDFNAMDDENCLECSHLEMWLTDHMGIVSDELKSTVDEMIYFLDWAHLKGWQHERDHYTLYDSTGKYYLIASILDSSDFIAYGLTIRCPWTTPKGELFLRKLREIKWEGK